MIAGDDARDAGADLFDDPCALVAQQLARGRTSPPGVFTAYDFLGAQGLVDGLAAAGFELLAGQRLDNHPPAT